MSDQPPTSKPTTSPEQSVQSQSQPGSHSQMKQKPTAAQARTADAEVEISDGVVRIVQLTDSHLGAQRGGKLLGMDTDHSLSAVIDLVEKERPHRDIVLGTGDLADRGAGDSYLRVQEHFSRLNCANFWLPGNHDDRDEMDAAVSVPSRLGRHIRAGSWQILMLDSQVPGEVGGELGAAELAYLEEGLHKAEKEGWYSLVCLHHQPVTIGCNWLDEQMVADADDFFAVIERYSGVRGVLWGHVHQEHDEMRQGVRLMASPSTCVQFAPGSRDFKADDKPPGYRWLELHENGEIESEVSRVWDVEFVVELDSGGYL